MCLDLLLGGRDRFDCKSNRYDWHIAYLDVSCSLRFHDRKATIRDNICSVFISTLYYTQGLASMCTRARPRSDACCRMADLQDSAANRHS